MPWQLLKQPLDFRSGQEYSCCHQAVALCHPHLDGKQTLDQSLTSWQLKITYSGLVKLQGQTIFYTFMESYCGQVGMIYCCLILQCIGHSDNLIKFLPGHWIAYHAFDLNLAQIWHLAEIRRIIVSNPVCRSLEGKGAVIVGILLLDTTCLPFYYSDTASVKACRSDSMIVTLISWCIDFTTLISWWIDVVTLNYSLYCL